MGNHLALELGNHLTLELGNDLALKLGNHLTLELRNQLTPELGNQLALQSSIVGNIRGPRQPAQVDEMHHEAHDKCFIANSVHTNVRIVQADTVKEK